VRAVWSELRKRAGPEFELIPVTANYRRGYCEISPDFIGAAADAAVGAPVSARAGDVFLGLDLSAQFLPLHTSQLRAWRKAGATIHLVVYDLLPLTRPDLFTSRTVSRFRRWFDVLSQHCDEAICISRQVGRVLREQLQIRGSATQPAISYLRLGSDIAASQPTTGVPDAIAQLVHRMRFRPTILMVGTVEPRKSYNVALAAFEYLWDHRAAEAPDLVIVGKPGWKTDTLQTRLRNHPEHSQRLHWLESVTDEALCCLYESSRGLLMTSQAEGFGLPLLEAQAHGRKVLARDLPVFREQDLPNVDYFEDDAPAVLGEAILRLATGVQSRPSDTVRLATWSDGVEGLLERIGRQAPSAQDDDARLRNAS